MTFEESNHEIEIHELLLDMEELVEKNKELEIKLEKEYDRGYKDALMNTPM
jgi:hypothetical protein